MRLCKNGWRTPDNFEELTTMLLWYLAGAWNETPIEGIQAEFSRGVLANSGGFAHAKAVVYVSAQYRHLVSPLAVALKAPYVVAGRMEAVLFTDFSIRVGSPSELNFYFQSGYHEKHDSMTVQETLERVCAQREAIEREVLRGGSLDNVEWMAFSRGSVRFAFFASLDRKKEDMKFLETIPRSVSGEHKGITKKLAVSVHLNYSSFFARV